MDLDEWALWTDVALSIPFIVLLQSMHLVAVIVDLVFLRDIFSVVFQLALIKYVPITGM